MRFPALRPLQPHREDFFLGALLDFFDAGGFFAAVLLRAVRLAGALATGFAAFGRLRSAARWAAAKAARAHPVRSSGSSYSRSGSCQYDATVTVLARVW